MSSDVLLDTHALLWWLNGGDGLSASAVAAIERATQRFVSSISFWEIGMLVQKNRIGLDRDTQLWTTHALEQPGVSCIDVTPPIAVVAAGLEGFHGDPADRLITSSALAAGVALVTKDTRITGWADTSMPELRCLW